MDQTVTLTEYEATALRGVLFMRREQLRDEMEALRVDGVGQSLLDCYQGAIDLANGIYEKIEKKILI